MLLSANFTQKSSSHHRHGRATAAADFTRNARVQGKALINFPLRTDTYSRGEHTMLIDVSHTVEHGMITYRGLPAPIICDFLSREQSRPLYADGTEFHIGKIEMVANTGTYLDSPFHRYANGKDLSELPLERLANLEAVVIHADPTKGRAINRAALERHDLRGKAVLIHTGWDVHWRTDQYFEGHPFLTKDAARHLADAGVSLVGIDSLNIDDTGDLTRPVHSILLAAEVPIVEHLRGLHLLANSRFRFFAVPVKVKNIGTFPVRAFGMVVGSAGAVSHIE
jgi:kynurenine formamidase